MTSPALLTKEQVANDPYGLMKLRRAYELSQNRTGMVVGLPHVNIESSQVNHALVYIDKLREHIAALEQRVEAMERHVVLALASAQGGLTHAQRCYPNLACDFDLIAVRLNLALDRPKEPR